MNSVRGKNIWIIGASSGIGYALAHEIAARGASLILSARSEDQLHKLNDKMGGDHNVMPLDVANHDMFEKVTRDVEGLQAPLDSVIFLAAIYNAHDGQPKEIDFVHKAIHVNLGGAFNLVHFVRPIFDRQGFGQIALCGSIAGYRGLPSGQPYCATKAGIINYAESLYVELKPHNIDVKVICPGFVKTPLTDKNNFPMPMIITAGEAAKHIADGLTKRAFEIHFPKRFTYIMKFLRLLPNWLYFKIIGYLRPQ